MKYASKDLYDYANQMPSLKRCIKKSVLDFLNLSGVSPEKEKRWYDADVTSGDIAIFKKTELYLKNRSRFDSYSARFAAAVNNIEIGTQRIAAEKHRGETEHPIVAAAKEIYREFNRKNVDYERSPRLNYDYSAKMSF